MVKENKETTATRKKPKSWNLISWKFSCSREVCLKKREGGGETTIWNPRVFWYFAFTMKLRKTNNTIQNVFVGYVLIT